MDMGEGEGEAVLGELANPPVVVYSVEDVVSDFFFDRIRGWCVRRHSMVVL